MHSTGRKMELRPTHTAPKASHKVDAHVEGKCDVNHYGSAYMRGILRRG
jgi:hypothetical protein